jgi:acyl-CoA reductase-like NAD-dependent aldehyde dehydrogenase
MRVHANQINPNIQLDAMYAAQKAAAKRETARTRKKLMEFASELAGEAEDCIVELGSREESDPQANRGKPQRPLRTHQSGGENPNSPEYEAISDWA